MTHWVPPPCPLLRWAKLRTNASLSASLAPFSKLPPSSTPGSTVFTDPVTLRYSAGADIFGSNVSTWVGPPPSHSQTTDVLFVGEPVCAVLARARSRSGSSTPVAPSAPTRRKSRRVVPPQAARRREFTSWSMEVDLGGGTWGGGGGCGRAAAGAEGTAHR